MVGSSVPWALAMTAETRQDSLEFNSEPYTAQWIVTNSEPVAQVAVLAPEEVSESSGQNSLITHWAQSFIEPLAARGILGEFTGNLDPEQTLTRGQFAAILNQAFGVSASSLQSEPEQKISRVEALGA
ncbi:MAG: S-layer homology domain-containing protein, partial [Oscillatoriales cyanobacterium RM1_1_9]|nr:S-layer homology domain-containing protein [Oscillatoriales cyanobacterium RM1_1_9]